MWFGSLIFAGLLAVYGSLFALGFLFPLGSLALPNGAATWVATAASKATPSNGGFYMPGRHASALRLGDAARSLNPDFSSPRGSLNRNGFLFVNGSLSTSGSLSRRLPAPPPRFRRRCPSRVRSRAPPAVGEGRRRTPPTIPCDAARPAHQSIPGTHCASSSSSALSCSRTHSCASSLFISHSF